MWKHCCVFVCALVACLLSSESFLSAQDPSTQPLVQFADLVSIGAFRLPRAPMNGDDFSIGGKPFTFNPARNSLFVGSRLGKIAEVGIPELNRSTDINTLWFAPYLQGFYDPMEGNITQLAAVDANIEGILAQNGRVYGTAAIYYDAGNIQRVSHYSRSTDLAARSFYGMVPVWQADHSGFVSGYMATVPPEWQQRLGGPAVTGQCCTPIAWKTSWGPSAFSFDPANIGATSPVPAQPLLYYSNEHATLGPWDGSGTVYSATTRIGGLVLIQGTRTALYFGSIGTGEHCYGNGTSNPALHRQPSGETIWCYDPTNTDKGSHAYPYRYQIWAYDLNEFTAVREGRKQPWDVVPYGVWRLDFPFPEIHARLGGVAYDAQRQILYVSQMYADTDGYANRALVHALRINNAPATLPVPTPTLTPPSGSGTISTVTLVANRPSPQPPNTTITWTATPAGGIRPYEYQFWVHNGSSWTNTAWSTSNTFNWTPTAATGNERVAIRVRSYASLESYEATTEVWYPISTTATATPPTTPPPSTPPPAPPTSGSGPVTAVALNANLASPQAPGTTITWTASPTGGASPQQYQWWIYNGSWTAVTGWTTSNTFAWQPTTANANYRIAVWARGGASTGGYEATAEKYFPISGTAVATPPPAPPPTSGSGTVTSVALNANLASPQPPGTSITWTATPTGGVSPQQYQWWIYNGSWTAATSWTTQNTFAWQPATANANYRVAVWVRGGSSTGSYEATAERYFPISGTAVSTPPPAPPPTSGSGTVGSVTLNANLASPQLPNTLITWSAIPTGGVSPQQYQWWIYNGAWTAATSWTTASTFAWQPTTANANYRVAVWVRSAGSTGSYEATAEKYFPISGTAVTPPPPPPTSTPTARASSVSIASNLAAPQITGTTITWTATVTGGTAPYQYQWWTFNGVSWVSQPWTTSNTFAWRPTTAGSSWRVAVWVRSNGNTSNVETTTEQWFRISQ